MIERDKNDARTTTCGLCSLWDNTVEQAEDQAVTVARPTVASLNKADPAGHWELEAFVRAVDTCRASVQGESGGRSTGTGDGSCIMYVKLVLCGSRGAVAVGDSYAVLPPDRRAEGWAGAPSLPVGRAGRLLLLTGTTRSHTYARTNHQRFCGGPNNGLVHNPSAYFLREKP